MAFMIPQYEYGEFATITHFGEFEWCGPAEYVHDVVAEICGDGEDCEIERETGWFCRLGAPGYLDCTDWSGPFDTEQQARDHIRETWDVDPDTGESIDWENDND